MKHGILVAFLFSAALLQPGLAAAQSPAARSELGANAALSYWQAIALMPALELGQQTLLHDWNSVPLDAAALELIDKYKVCRVYLHRGAKVPRCDWGENYADGVRMILPHVPKVITLARLAGLNARYEFAQGNWKAGAEDVAAILGLSRHMEMDRIIISNLVGARIEAIAIDTAAPYLPELKVALPETVSAVLDVSPSGATLSEMVLMEKQVGPIWMIRELMAAEQRKPGSWQTVWKEVFEAPKEKGLNPDDELARSVKSFEQAIKALDDILPWYDELALVVSLPREGFDARYPDVVKKAKAASPVGGLFLPAMDKVVEVRRRNEAQRSLFKAAIAVVQSGPETLKAIKDPFGDGPFEYHALDRGFELKSKLISQGKPVSLTVGQAKKS